MPIVEVDGQEIEFPDDMGQDQIKAVLRQKFPPKNTQFDAKEGLARTVFDQGMQGASFGFADEISDRLGAGIAALATDQSYGDMLQEARGLTKERQKRQFEQHPVASIASNVAGGLVTGGAGAATKTGTAIGNLLRSGNLAARVGKGALAGATSGAAYGAGTAEDGKRLDGAGQGSIYGGIAGAALPAVGAALSKANTRVIIPGSEEVRAKGGELFKQAETMGGNVPPQVADQFRSKVLSHLNLDSEAKLYSSNPVAERLTKNLQDFAGQPLSFNTAKQIDEALGDLAYGTMDNFGKLSSEGKKFLDLQASLRDAMDSVPDNEIVREARKYWSTSLRMREIERIIEKAQGKEQPVTAIKNGFSALLNRGDKLKSYSVKEVKAIRKAAKTGIVTDVIKLAGSGLVPIGSGIAGSVGGIPGSAAGFLVGTAIQQGAKAAGVARQSARANAALKAAAERSGMVQVQKRIPIGKIREILKLPPSEARLALEKLNQPNQ
jgi:hypothetical protein